MQLLNEFQPIREWAFEKGILSKGDSKTQTLKLMEEVGELSKGVLTKNLEEVQDAIGDCVVVLTSIASMNGLTIEECINSAYSVVKNRQGEMKNGNFVKNS